MRLPLILCGLAFASPGAAQTHLVVVTGLAGETKYAASFQESAVTLLESARDRMGVAEDRLMYLADRPEDAGFEVRARSTRAEVTSMLTALAGRASPDALVVIVLIGHGSALGGTLRINLPGPDLTADDVSAVLAGFPTQDLVVVNTASASGGWVAALSGPRRTIITATRSAAEREESRFHRFFSLAFATDAADTDKNGRISVLEAFAFANREVARFYETDNRLRTEHALLDDNGDGRGSLDPDPTTGDGAVAATLYLDSVEAVAVSDPALANLLSRRDSLEQALGMLRQRRERTPPADYERALETLLLEIARVGRAIRAREGAQ